MTTDQQPTDTEHPPGATLHLGGNAWAHPDLQTQLAPAEDLTPYPGNPRRGDQNAITASLRDLGLYRTVIVQRSTGHVLAGNHTLRGLLALGAERVPVTWVDVPDARAAAIVARDNKTSDAGTYDDEELLALLTSDEEVLALSGYLDEELEELRHAIDEEAAEDPEEGDNRAPTTGERLSIADVTWGEPRRKLHHGEVWQLGQHTLVVAKLHTEHALWTPLLTAEHLFAPYPEPYITASEVARERPLLLVQPNVFLAGHLLDKHESVWPDEKIRKVEP